MPARYIRRRELANLSRFPEGYEVRHQLLGSQMCNFFVLTPPDQVAVQRENGSWYRRSRVEEQDGPAPYSVLWYQTYLMEHGMPQWFMQPEHTHLLQDDTEAQMLGRTNEPYNSPPPADYLQVRYPSKPELPTPDIYGTGQVYAYEMSEEEQLKVARRFPATNAVPATFEAADTDEESPHYRIHVLPSGHIFVQHPQEAGDDDLVMGREAMPWQTASSADVTSSYVLEGSQQQESTVPSFAHAATRLAHVRLQENEGGIVNPSEIPQGPGQWEWLTEEDDYHAQALGFRDQVDVTQAREAGLLAQGISSNDAPAVVWKSDPRYFNPPTPPEGPGRWEYFTPSARTLAWLNYGGREGFDFADILRPSATDIWRLRQNYQWRIQEGENIDDYTAGGDGDRIDLVWIPGAQRRSPDIDSLLGIFEGDDLAESSPSESSISNVGDSEREDLTGPNIGEIDPISGETHEPYNRGENDQTGTHGKAQYQTRILPEGEEDAKKITVDRSRCYVNVKEPWKAWLAGKKGQWIRYHGFGDLGWDNKKEVEKLNKWRDQTFNRHEWPLKRGPRTDYTEEEQKWLFEYVKAASGNRIGREKLEPILTNFNAEFASRPGRTDRSLGGLDSEIERLKTMWKELGEYRPSGRKRGENLKQRRDAMREAKAAASEHSHRLRPTAANDEDSEEELPPRKKAKIDASKVRKHEGEKDVPGSPE